MCWSAVAANARGWLRTSPKGRRNRPIMKGSQTRFLNDEESIETVAHSRIPGRGYDAGHHTPLGTAVGAHLRQRVWCACGAAESSAHAGTVEFLQRHRRVARARQRADQFLWVEHRNRSRDG